MEISKQLTSAGTEYSHQSNDVNIQLLDYDLNTVYARIVLGRLLLRWREIYE